MQLPDYTYQTSIGHMWQDATIQDIEDTKHSYLTATPEY